MTGLYNCHNFEIFFDDIMRDSNFGMGVLHVVRQPGSYTLHGKLKFFFRWILYHWDLYNAYPADNKSVSLS